MNRNLYIIESNTTEFFFLIKRPAREACLHIGGILTEGSAVSAVSAVSASLPTYSVFTSFNSHFKAKKILEAKGDKKHLLWSFHGMKLFTGALNL